MHIVAALDSFKGSISSLSAGNAVRSAAAKVWPEAKVTVCPVADGGEGTVEALCTGLGGQLVSPEVTGPCFEPVTAKYCILPDGITAVIEMAQASGLPLVPAERRNPLHTTTYGVGELILNAVSRGCRRFIVGIGGSATNDGGIGMLSALGVEFLNGEGLPVRPTAYGLGEIRKILPGKLVPELAECSFRVACDVKNPLCGELGCSAVFAPQKGASPEDIAKMDADLANYARLAQSFTGKTGVDTAHGAGAAGGLGFAFLNFLNASLEPGIEIVLDQTGLEEKIASADLVITGEGRLDGQTAMGKAPVGIARLAKKHSRPVIALAGGIAPGAEACNDVGIDAFFPIVRGVTTLEEALNEENAEKNLEAAAVQVFRLIDVFGKDAPWR